MNDASHPLYMASPMFTDSSKNNITGEVNSSSYNIAGGALSSSRDVSSAKVQIVDSDIFAHLLSKEQPRNRDGTNALSSSEI
jgi:hypothetical protein